MHDVNNDYKKITKSRVSNLKIIFTQAVGKSKRHSGYQDSVELSCVIVVMPKAATVAVSHCHGEVLL